MCVYINTASLSISASFQLNLDFYKKLDIFLGPQLTTLVSDMAEQCNRNATTTNTEVHYKFVYFNQLNLAQKSTVHLDNRRTGNVCVSHEVMRLLADINSDKDR